MTFTIKVFLVNTLKDLNWRVDHLFGSSNVEVNKYFKLLYWSKDLHYLIIKKMNERTATLQFKINNIVENHVESHAVTLDATQLKLLIHGFGFWLFVANNLDFI